jgi:hypothetical protein
VAELVTPKSRELWKLAASLEEMALHLEHMGLSAGALRRLSIQVGEKATQVEQSEPLGIALKLWREAEESGDV